MSAAPAIPSFPAPSAAAADRRTLLIVDDEEGPRQSLRVVFKREYNLLLTSNGQEAVALARQRKIDAAILDIRMAGMSGIEVLQALKAVDPHIEVIMLTAYESIDTVRQALRLGACDYLNKPFDIPTLRAAVANAMDRRSLSSEVSANVEKLRALQDELQSQKVEEAMVRSRGEIYASIIHDINGPLTIMSGFLQLINARMGDATVLEGHDLELVRDRLRRITKQVTNCVEISRRYLSFLRQNPGENMRVSANQTLADLAELMRVHPAVKRSTFTVRPLAEDVTVQINGTDFIQVLRNLSVNALQCSEQPHTVEVVGEVLNDPLPPLEDGADRRWIQSGGFRNHAPLLAVTIRDDGPGIPPENIRRLFVESFTTKASGAGTGLGLSIVKRLVGRANGAIAVRTTLGRGSEFVVYLSLE
jgi:signal transduction histidine kinase